VGPGETFTISVTVTNDGDLKAIAPEVTLTLPSGYSLASGDNPRTLAGIAGGDDATTDFSVRASSVTELVSLSVSAETDSYGITDTSDVVSRSQQVDADPPTGSILIDDGDETAGSTSVTLTLSATDAIAGVEDMRFSNDGAAWADWETYATTRDWTLGGAEGVQTVYVQYRDAVLNVSSTYSDDI
jgi:uncharacterized repeat protein (TIGR01451 family)